MTLTPVCLSALATTLHTRKQVQEIVSSCIGTKFSSRWGPHMVDLAVDSVVKVVRDVNGYKECDTKRYVRIEKVRQQISFSCGRPDGSSPWSHLHLHLHPESLDGPNTAPLSLTKSQVALSHVSFPSAVSPPVSSSTLDGPMKPGACPFLVPRKLSVKSVWVPGDHPVNMVVGSHRGLAWHGMADPWWRAVGLPGGGWGHVQQGCDPFEDEEED